MAVDTAKPADVDSLSAWMTAKEVADWLGVSTRVLSANRIPHAKIGERRFYNAYAVAAWLTRRAEQS